MTHRHTTEIPSPSETELVDREYTPPQYASEVAEYPPPSLVIGSISAQPGAFTANPLNDDRLKYVTAARTTIIFASDPNGGENIVPVQSAWEEENLPYETRHHLPLCSALVMINQENNESADSLKQKLKSPHTHPTAPHMGIFTSQKVKKAFRESQIGQETVTEKMRRLVDPKCLTGDDGVSW